MSGCALVTGGSKGIGAATALSLADLGHAVAIVYRADADAAASVVAQIEAQGGTALAVQADLAEAAAADRVFDVVEEQLGEVSVLVNNAGTRADGLAMALTDAQWEQVLNLNLAAAFRCSRRALRRMVRARHGRIVNVASVIAFRGNPGQVNYAAAKAGMLAMTRTTAMEVARRGVTVNAVAPGFIPTALTEDVDPEMVKNFIPARRVGTPEEVAACIRFLASDAASYVTGTALTVDGGLSA
ncbi:MAG TPA: 3-oxoacyl-ACP reductase FabG [Solirubrobacteraceae bacterium]|nr:3-oxoacyl-ACP reductase FabG [Solirubrobacteraceae bacterium]